MIGQTIWDQVTQFNRCSFKPADFTWIWKVSQGLSPSEARKRSGTNFFSHYPMSAWLDCSIDIWCGPVLKCRPTDEQMGWWKARSSCSIRSSCSRHFLVLKNNRNVISIQLSNWFICLLKKIISMSRPSWNSRAVLCNKMRDPYNHEGTKARVNHAIILLIVTNITCNGNEANENRMKWGGFTVQHKKDSTNIFIMLEWSWVAYFDTVPNQQPSQVITLPLNQYYCQHCVVCNK